MKAVSKRSFIIGLLLLSCLGVVAVHCAVPRQSGGMWDSVLYVGTARNLASGSGLYLADLQPRTPFTQWPPLYPVMLAVPALFGIDPWVSSTWLDGVCFSCTIFLAGYIAWACCNRQLEVGFFAAMLIASSPDLIEIHSQVLSEAPFNVLLLACIALLVYFIESGKTTFLFGLALALSAALLTRYAGISILISVCLVIALNWQRLKQQSVPVTNLVLALVMSVLPLTLWLVRNVFVKGGMVGGRRIMFHPPKIQALRELLQTVTRWFAPALVPGFLRLFFLLAILAAIAITFLPSRKIQSRNPDIRIDRASSLAGICLAVGGVYLVFLLLTLSFADALSTFQLRLMLPLFPVTVLLLTSCLGISRQRSGAHSVTYRALFAICVLIISANSVRSVAKVRNIRTNGVGFQTAEWRDEGIQGYLRHLPDDAKVYSDNCTLVYYMTDRASYLLPEKFSIMTTLANNEYQEQMKSLAESGSRDRVNIILFHTSWENGPFASLKEFQDDWGFHPVLRSAKGNYVLAFQSTSSKR